ncbi:MAG: tRNA 5-methoxyuridine(34)/uridine 5-oxyacetic acid(34) synthase CmoB [Pseudomonadota bacterium]|nr:tRNA 5-methoxyuridine(34)/uridine 5-oxyacetic acid(34) synthase CmoB [Pseudomonadota bacterium]
MVPLPEFRVDTGGEAVTGHGPGLPKLAPPIANWGEAVSHRVAAALGPGAHGRMTEWMNVLRELPAITPSRLVLDAATVTIGAPGEVDGETQGRLEQCLRALRPWRKGPFEVFGIPIDTEWRSDMKWDRLSAYIEPLDGRCVLDVGCGSGYHVFRMAGKDAGQVVGVEPSSLYVMQFHALRRYASVPQVTVLPLALEDLPADGSFDTVFSMGVLYHRRSPLDHLLHLRGQLRRGGQLVLETLVVEGQAGHALLPEGRYARMRNVWMIPSPDTVTMWLRRCRFADVRCIDATPTRETEQRQTDWMPFESLTEALDPDNPALTVEGHPAPVRAVFLARAA